VPEVSVRARITARALCSLCLVLADNLRSGMFILSEHRNSFEAIEAGFLRYRAYLSEQRAKFPPRAYALATSTWYWSPADSRCPHDGWLESLVAREIAVGVRAAEIQVRLEGAYRDGFIELSYSHVRRYECRAPDLGTGHGDWLWDEIRLAPDGGIEHEIEWATGARWLIHAGDVSHAFIPLADRAPVHSAGEAAS
jgi:hypothetical protein